MLRIIARPSGTKREYYDVDDNTLLSDNILVEGIWRHIYRAINRTNYVLLKLEDVDFLDEDEKHDYQGQLRFLRALHYFNLVRLYGDVPLKLQPTTEDDTTNVLPRTPVSQVYQQIIDDLLFAEENIENVEPQFATSSAATAFLASVFLTRQNYSLAIEYADKVLLNVRNLEFNYADLFSGNLEPSQEIIFYVAFASDDKNRMAEYHFPYELGGRHENAPSRKID